MNPCEECLRCIPLGEGDHLCEDLMELVIVGYTPTEKYGNCKKQIKKEKKHESI